MKFSAVKGMQLETKNYEPELQDTEKGREKKKTRRVIWIDF